MSLLAGTSGAEEQPLAVNFVAVTESLHTAGQPDATHLSGLGARGYGMVVNLAPPTSRGSIETEGRLVAAAGITYVNIPVDWQNPAYADFELFSDVLDHAAGRKVLVHCQMNMRASMFTFLYRVVRRKVPPAEAFQYVRQVWLPQDQWLSFGRMVLQKHNIDFEIPAE
jgi:protein tyrosine phosphatase (PTP) superfamily phosphohydrolase (DUF442 family)